MRNFHWNTLSCFAELNVWRCWWKNRETFPHIPDEPSKPQNFHPRNFCHLQYLYDPPASSINTCKLNSMQGCSHSGRDQPPLSLKWPSLLATNQYKISYKHTFYTIFFVCCSHHSSKPGHIPEYAYTTVAYTCTFKNFCPWKRTLKCMFNKNVTRFLLLEEALVIGFFSRQF